jgi:alpha-1,2-mannosyltransferase
MLRRFRSAPPIQRFFVVLCLLVITIQWVVVTLRRRHHLGDFDVAREFGRRFLTGEPLYAGGLHYPHTPSAAMYLAPLALVPSTIGLALRYGVALASLWLTLRLLHVMVRDRHPEVASHRFTIAALTIVLAAQYILRDLGDGGPHLIILAIVTAGVYCVWSSQTARAALCFGLATVLNVTLAIFLPFLLWKRQWRLATYTAVAIASWTLLPMAWLGWASWYRYEGEWTEAVVASIRGLPVAAVAGAAGASSQPAAEAGLADPAATAVEVWQPFQNQALRPAAMRYLDPVRRSHPAHLPKFVLPDALVSQLATLIMLVLLTVCGWLGSARYRGQRDPRWLLECSAVLIVAVLYAPLAWVQHFVLAIPALYLIVAEDRAIRPLGRLARTAMGLYFVLAVILNRGVVGEQASLLLLAYSMHTIGLLILLGVLLLRCPTATVAATSPGPSMISAPRTHIA